MSAGKKTATGKDFLSELFFHLKVDEHLVEKVVPISVEDAIRLGEKLPEHDWFNPEHIQFGGIFQITDVMTDLRNIGGPHWDIVCTMVDNMPEKFSDVDDDPDNPESPYKIYENLAFNMRNVRNGTEDRSPEGIKQGHRILCPDKKKAS